MILAAWIVGILVLGGLLWFFTQNFRDNRMLRAVNAVLMNNNDKRRLVSRLTDGSEKRTSFQNYQRFSVWDSSETAVIITLYDNAIPSVCAVFIDSNGKVIDMLPLNSHSVQVMARMEKRQLNMYKMHIEEHEKQLRSEE